MCYSLELLPTTGYYNVNPSKRESKGIYGKEKREFCHVIEPAAVSHESYAR
jgi:hypothetical protein